MTVTLTAATAEYADAVAQLRNASARALTTKHGPGAWSGQCTARGVHFDQRTGQVWLARLGEQTVATLKLAAKKPWAIDRSYFSPVARPVYLTALAVAPEFQSRGVGRACLEQAVHLAREFPADAICLDAFDHPAAGAGEFYRKCGFRETGRKVYHGVPLVYFEMLL